MLSLGQTESDVRQNLNVIRNNFSSIQIQQMIRFSIAKQLTIFLHFTIEMHWRADDLYSKVWDPGPLLFSLLMTNYNNYDLNYKIKRCKNKMAPARYDARTVCRVSSPTACCPRKDDPAQCKNRANFIFILDT